MSIDAQFGYSVAGGASSVTNRTISGTASILNRDLFNAQQERLPRLRSELFGAGTPVIIPNANSGGNPRLVIERNTNLTGFTGTFRLTENHADRRLRLHGQQSSLHQHPGPRG